MTFPGFPQSPANPPADIRRYAPRRTPGALLWATLVGLVMLGFVLGGLYARFNAPAEPTPVASPSPDATVAAGPGLPFEMPHDSSATGRWEIRETVWEHGGVSLKIRVFADTGKVSYGFTSFAHDGQQAVSPTSGTRTPELEQGVLSAGESAEGWIFLPLPRGAATLILTTDRGWQISALAIEG